MTDAHPPLRSYGRLKARPIKPRQAALVEQRLPELRIPAGPVDARALKPDATETWLEIGFGGGEHMAAQSPRRFSSYRVVTWSAGTRPATGRSFCRA